MVDNQESVVRVKGFAMYTDSQSEDMVPWMPLKTGGWVWGLLLRNGG